MGLSGRVHMGRSFEPVGFITRTLNLSPGDSSMLVWGLKYAKGTVCCLDPMCSDLQGLLCLVKAFFFHVSKPVSLCEKIPMAPLILGFWDAGMPGSYPVCCTSFYQSCWEQFPLQAQLNVQLNASDLVTLQARSACLCCALCTSCC